MENFGEDARDIAAAGTAVQVQNPTDLFSALDRLLEDGATRLAMSAAARDLAAKNSIAAESVTREILAVYSRGSARVYRSPGSC